MAKGRVLAIVAALAVLWTAASAVAQPVTADLASLAGQGGFARDRNVSVQERPHPEWDAMGVRFGGLILFPTLGLSGAFTDNLYATASGVGAAALHVQPSLVLRSDRPDRRLIASASIDTAAIESRSSEATTDYTLGGALAVQTPRSLGWEVAAGFSRKTEPRTSPDSPPGALTPVQYNLAEGRFGLAATLNRIRLSVRTQVRDFTFDGVRSSSGASLPQDFRDRTETTAILRGEYALRPAESVFIAGGVVARVYRNHPGPLLDRSSTGSRLEAGVSFDGARLMRGEVAVGYLTQDYQGRYASVSGPSARARLDAFPTQLTTLSFTAGRAVEESVSPASGGYLASTIKAEVNHELLRNLLLNASGAYEADAYPGVSRQDRRTVVQAGLRYAMNRGVVLTAQLERDVRRSDGAQRGLAYAANRAMLGLTLRC